MAEVSVTELAKTVGASVDCLLMQMTKLRKRARLQSMLPHLLLTPFKIKDADMANQLLMTKIN